VSVLTGHGLQAPKGIYKYPEEALKLLASEVPAAVDFLYPELARRAALLNYGVISKITREAPFVLSLK
jgi:hypothetical protein